MGLFFIFESFSVFTSNDTIDSTTLIRNGVILAIFISAVITSVLLLSFSVIITPSKQFELEKKIVHSKEDMLDMWSFINENCTPAPLAGNDVYPILREFQNVLYYSHLFSISCFSEKIYDQFRYRLYVKTKKSAKNDIQKEKRKAQKEFVKYGKFLYEDKHPILYIRLDALLIPVIDAIKISINDYPDVNDRNIVANTVKKLESFQE